MKRSVLIFFIVIVLLLIANLALLSYLAVEYLGGKGGKGDFPYKKIATYLLSKGIDNSAVVFFDEYVKLSSVSNEERAKVAYKIGNIYFDNLDYANAVTYFYISEIFAPNPEYKDDLNSKIVESLERLGLSAKAKYELKSRASLNPSDKSAGENAIAKIGDRNITRLEVEESFDALPDFVKKNYEGDGGFKRYLRDYVAKEVLYQKALRRNLDRKRDIVNAVKNFKKDIVVGKMLEEEVNKKVDITDDDIKLYYEAHRGDFVIPRALKVSYIEVGDGDNIEDLKEKLRSGEGIKVDEWVDKNKTEFGGFSDAAVIYGKIKDLKKGGISPVVEYKDKKYIFIADDVRPEVSKSFDEVKDLVAYRLRFDKVSKVSEKLLKDALEEDEVEFFDENNGEEDENTNEK